MGYMKLEYSFGDLRRRCPGNILILISTILSGRYKETLRTFNYPFKTFTKKKNLLYEQKAHLVIKDQYK